MTNTQTPKLRSACDACHEAKVKCTGGSPCVHCKNHHETCHYSFAARIGKPKGSRNRKTLARLREAALQAATSHPSCPTPPVTFVPSPYSVSPQPVSTIPEWVNSDYSVPSTQYASYPSYAWVSPQPIPTPPASIDLSLKQIQAHDDAYINQQQQRQPSQSQPASLSRPLESAMHSPHLSTSAHSVSADSVNPDIYLSFPDMDCYPAAWQSAVCDCFHRQTSNLASLHALKSPMSTMQHNTFEESLQCITSILSTCQQTVACRSCEKRSSMMFILIASLQMAFDHLNALLSSEQQSTPTPMTSFSSVADPILNHEMRSDQQKVIRMMQLRHMLLKTQNTLKDIREIIYATQQSSPVDVSFYPGLLEAGMVSSGDPACLQQILDKLQVGIGSLLSTVGTRQA